MIDGTAHTAATTLDDETERLTLTLDGEVAAGPATVQVTFDGTLNDQLHGFYRSTYTADDGTEHTIATTQFQSTDARRCFPCWDEPEYKATFETTLIVDADHLAVTNTSEVAETTLDDGRRRIQYAPTMVMSTYLVVCRRAVGGHRTDPCGRRAHPFVHRPGQGDRTPFALDVAAAALDWFADYYAIPYPSDKVDLIAIPDFAFGAMENLGCVTFREVLLIIDPADASQPELQRAADVINHELAHMWFGDLVTMQWWEGIWLNEAFATFMETSAATPTGPTGESGTRSRGPDRRRSTSTPSPRPARSSSRSSPHRKPRGCSTSSPTRRAPPSSACSSNTSAPRSSATACATTSKPTRTRTPKPPTCGPRSKRSRVSRCSR